MAENAVKKAEINPKQRKKQQAEKMTKAERSYLRRKSITDKILSSCTKNECIRSEILTVLSRFCMI